MMREITAIGEVLIDLTQIGVSESGIPLFAANPGGAPANVAVAAARLGARTAKRSGVLVGYDPNFRPALWRDEAEAIEWMRIPLPLVDVIKLSEEELPLLTGSENLEEGSRRLAGQSISLVLVTLGSKGSFCRWKGGCITVPGVDVTVADTNGAGDTFLGAVLSRLCCRGDRPLEGLTAAELRDILQFANRAAAITCSRSGAIPAMPTLTELR